MHIPYENDYLICVNHHFKCSLKSEGFTCKITKLWVSKLWFHPKFFYHASPFFSSGKCTAKRALFNVAAARSPCTAWIAVMEGSFSICEVIFQFLPFLGLKFTQSTVEEFEYHICKILGLKFTRSAVEELEYHIARCLVSNSHDQQWKN
jgi:hypothetical protein